jgi:hypothetical protein
MNAAGDPDSKAAPAGGWFPRATRVAGLLWKFATRAVLAAFVLLLLIPLRSAIFDRSFVVGEFSVPDDLQKSGVTSSVVARLFFDRVAEMQRVARSAVAESHLGTRAFGADDTASKVADLRLPGADISLVTLISQLRALLRIQDTKIVGEIVVARNAPEVTYLLRAHATGGDVWVEFEEGRDVTALVNVVATRLVERFDPLVAGFYYFRTPKPDKSNLDAAIGFAEGFHSKDATQQAWALVLRGLAWREKQGNPAETRASLCAAIDRDRSFIAAWRILGESLRVDASLGEAQDLALRLVHSQPEEPEGYRQLGSLRRDCMAGPEQEQEAKRFFEKAIELGARSGRGEPDYLSRLDYARFLYTWYREPAPPPPGSPPIPDPMDVVVGHLRQAQAIAPDEPSIYAVWARARGHPRNNENASARGSRLLDAELKARFALTQDSTSAFANVVMGELLTDEGVEQHKYLTVEKFHEKFLKAKEFLDAPRRGTVRPESLYEAIFARALAGAGEFAQAEKILADFVDRTPPVYLAEWARGEMLYNQRRYEEALVHLKRAEGVRTCGPRSNVVRDLITKVETELASPQPARAGQSLATRSVVDAALPASIHEAKPLPEPKAACPGWPELQGDELSAWPERPARWWPFRGG